VNPIFTALGTTVFTEMSALAAQHGAVNLGQGFPDSEGPIDVREEAAKAILDGPNQYPPMQGLPALRQAIGAHYERFQALAYDPAAEVIVTAGATEAIAASILSLVSPGDEVVMIAPLYDAYLPMVRLAGGVPRFIDLKPPHWALTEEALSVIGPRTRVLILNNPLNPGAVAWSPDQLAPLAALCARHDITVISDEVWEHLVFDGRAHTPLASLPGMRDRTVKIGSAGKIFSLTGWKVGWACAPPPLAAQVAKAHQFLTFTVAPGTQAGVAYGLGKDDAYFTDMRAGYARSRDRLAAGLEAEGFAVLPSQSTYFLNIDLAASGIAMSDRDFCLRTVKEAGVAAIPVSAFYETDPVTHIVRLCFAKKDETLDLGIEGLAKAKRLFG
jgi:aspartate/methionine/tyrosine aminotransferase